jgi:glycosyltransferase involved in cell wall biosynthesis
MVELAMETVRSEGGPPPAAPPSALKRVLFVLQLSLGDKFSSLAEQTFTLARAFRDRGGLFLPVYLPPLDPASRGAYVQEGLTIEALDLASFRRATLHRLVRLIRDNRIEVVHWNFYHPLTNPYPWALSLLLPRLEHYYTDHVSRRVSDSRASRGAWLKRNVKWLLAQRYRKTLCISNFLCERLGPASWPRLRLLHYFINTERFRPDPETRSRIRRALGTGEEFVALVVAHLIPEKGVDVALRAMVDLPEPASLWVVGDGPERANLQALAGELDIERRVRFLGSHRDVAPFMQAADCLICPSIWEEGAGLVNLEGMACGLPDVASRIGGIPEFVKEGCNGFLCTSGDPLDLAVKVRRLIEDAEERRRMGAAARARILDRYSTDRLLDEHIQIYLKP